MTVREWNALATTLKFESESQMFEHMYHVRAWSISKIATVLECSTAAIQRRLRLAGIVRRGKGGRNSTARQTRKLFRVDPRVLYIMQLKTVAQETNVHVSTLYKFKRSTMEVDHELLSDLSAYRVGDVQLTQPVPDVSCTRNITAILEALSSDEGKGGFHHPG